MSEAIDIEDVDEKWIYPAFAYILHCVNNSTLGKNLLLRGSLLTSAIVDRAKFRKPKDLDFVYYEKEHAVENEDDPIPYIEPNPGYLERFDKYVEQFVDEIADEGCENFNMVAVTQVHKTWEAADFPGRKVMVKFYPEDYDDCFEIAVDFACGDPVIQQDTCYDLFELIPSEVQYDEYLECKVPAASVNMLSAWKIHSAMCEERWRPKDIYDLTLLLPHCKPPFLPYLKCAFSTTNNLDEKLDDLVNGRFCDEQEKEWGEGEFHDQLLETAVEIISFELSRLVPDTLWKKII